MEQIKIPDGYQSSLNLHDTQIAIKTCLLYTSDAADE